jgi:hypothetical protein
MPIATRLSWESGSSMIDRSTARYSGRLAGNPIMRKLISCRRFNTAAGRPSGVAQVFEQSIHELRVIVDLEAHGLERGGEPLGRGIGVRKHLQCDGQIVAFRRGGGWGCPAARPPGWTGLPQYPFERRLAPGSCLGFCRDTLRRPSLS